jgi:hypothetical protein
MAKRKIIMIRQSMIGKRNIQKLEIGKIQIVLTALSKLNHSLNVLHFLNLVS